MGHTQAAEAALQGALNASAPSAAAPLGALSRLAFSQDLLSLRCSVEYTSKKATGLKTRM